MEKPAKALPCPFCGMKPCTAPQDPAKEGDAWGEVYCANQNCPTFSGPWRKGVSVRDGEPVAHDHGSDAYIQAAIRRWNQRKG